MPSLAVTVPQYTRNTDLMDATDREFRQLESTLASCQMALQAARQLQNFNATTGVPTPGAYFMPASVAADQRSIYEALVASLVGTPKAIAGVRTAATIFTPTVSENWKVNGLAGLWVYSYIAGAETDGSWTQVVSNTATAVTITGTLFAGCDSIYIAGAPVTSLGLAAVLATLNAILAL